MINRVDVDEEPVERPFDLRMFVRLLGFLRPYRRLAAVAFVCLAVVSATTLAGPYLTKVAIDSYILKGRVGGLWHLAALYAALYAVRFLAGRYQQRLTALLGQHILFDLRQSLFDHIQTLTFRFFDRIPTGKIMTRILNDVSNLNALLSSGIIQTLTNILTLVGIVAIMVSLQPVLSLFAFSVLPVLFFLSTNLRRRIVERWRVVRRKSSNINANVAESVSGAKVIIAFDRQDTNCARFHDLNEDYKTTWMRAIRVNATFSPLVDLTGTVGTALVLWYGAYLILGHAVSVGLIVAFISYLGNFWGPISNLGMFYNTLLVAMASAERVFEYLDQVPEVQDAPDALDLPRVDGAVRFEHVYFGYQPSQPVLHDIDFSVRPGESIALVGPTGAGKSSILSLLFRFYDPVSGRILLDGVDIRRVRLASLRRHMAIVLQDTFIFAGTIRDNIRYARPEATDAEVERAARLSRAHDFISHLPDGYDTEVRERGSRLSVGQRQLLAIARAILADPAVLILDEATASVDAETEVLIQQGLRELLRGRTSFIVAHRLSTIRECDRIFVVDAGRIAEMGTHEELVARRGLYYQLLLHHYRLESPETDVPAPSPRAQGQTG